MYVRIDLQQLFSFTWECVRVCTHVRVYMRVCIFVCLCVCVCVCACACVCNTSICRSPIRLSGSMYVCGAETMCLRERQRESTRARTRKRTHKKLPEKYVRIDLQEFVSYFRTWPSDVSMGWLRLVGSLKLQVSFAKEPCIRDDILQKRPII